jgi:ABC-type branched-subunit amino acid transport system substrate-binding protein
LVDFDAVFIADDGKIAGQVIPTFIYRDAKNLTFLGMSSWNTSQFLQRTQDLSEGSLFPVAFNSLQPPKSTKAFYDLYYSTHNSYPGEFDAIAFDAASVVLKVMERDPSSRSDFRDRLERVSDVDAATGEISIEEHHCSRKLAIYTVKKGKFESVRE